MTYSVHGTMVGVGHFFEHAAVVALGLVMIVVGLGLGVTMIMLPVGVVVGLLGVGLVIAGLFARLTPPAR